MLEKIKEKVKRRHVDGLLEILKGERVEKKDVSEVLELLIPLYQLEVDINNLTNDIVSIGKRFRCKKKMPLTGCYSAKYWRSGVDKHSIDLMK
jgi:CRISPR/Cas system CSM-associated protein Csm5 (group 7 of RAMP superfamily)